MALLKMTILSFNSFDPKDTIVPRGLFVAMFNPASYKIEYAFTKDTKETTGSDAQSNPITGVSLKKMTFDFLVDGSGANGDQRIVLSEIKKFEKLVMPEKPKTDIGTDTKPKYLELPKLILIWGTFVFPCEIESFAVNYTLFSQLGIPLRATISATFNEVIPKQKLNMLDAYNEVLGNDTLTTATSFLSTAFTITNNIAKAVDMARDENLNSLRQKVDIKK